MWKDCLGRNINVGDIVYYPVNLGSRGGVQARWGEVIELCPKFPGNHRSPYHQNAPYIKVKAVQNTKDSLVICDSVNLIVNLSSTPINNISEIEN